MITRMRIGAAVVLALAVVVAVAHSAADGICFAGFVALIGAHYVTN